MGIFISVEEVFDNDHRIVSQRGSGTGRLTFSAADAGEHRICFTPTNVPSAQGWLTHGAPTGNIKFELDMAIGATSKIESSDKDKMTDLVTKVKDLNLRLQDIRREQIFQRVRCRTWLLDRFEANEWSGTRSRVQRSLGKRQRSRSEVDVDSIGRSGSDLRLAAVAFAVFLHQAEVDVEKPRIQVRAWKFILDTSLHGVCVMA